MEVVKCLCKGLSRVVLQYTWIKEELAVLIAGVKSALDSYISICYCLLQS